MHQEGHYTWNVYGGIWGGLCKLMFKRSLEQKYKQQPHERRTNSTRRRDDDSVSLSTRRSTNSQNGKILEITRTVRDRYGTEDKFHTAEGR